MVFDTYLAGLLSQKYYATLGAQALGLAPDEAARRFTPWCAAHFEGGAARAVASDTWFHTVLAKATARGCMSGDAVALDYLRFAKLTRAALANATWMGTPWLKAIRNAVATSGEGWRRADGIGLGLFRWDWSTLEPAEIRAQKIAPRPIWLVIVGKSEGRVHELSETLGRWLSAFPRSEAEVRARETQRYHSACADQTMLAQAQKLGLLVRTVENAAK